MIAITSRRSLQRMYHLFNRCKSGSVASSTDGLTAGNVQFDEVTHTGQAWDQADYRLARFEISKKQVNPNIAQKLVAEASVIETDEHIIFCDGGHFALGHPRVYINLDKPGNHSCGYCGQKFVNTVTTKGDDRGINHLVNT